MHLYQIENITFKPLMVIAEDYEHASQIFMHSVVTGFYHKPDADFDITKWRIKPRHRDKEPWSWIKEGNAGMLYRIEDGQSWELVLTPMRRS